MSVSTSKAIQILSKSAQKRSHHELHRLTTYLQDLLKSDQYNMLTFLAFYMVLHVQQGNLSRMLQQNSRIFLLQGSLRLQQKCQSQPQPHLITSPQPIPQTRSFRIYLQPNSIATSVSPLHYQNCELLSQQSSLQDEMQFLQTNNYFKKMGTITCLTLLSNCEVKRVIRGQKVGSLSSQMEEVCFVRRGEVEVHKRALVQEGVRDQMVAMTVGEGEFFGYFVLKDPSNQYTIKCKSAYATLFCFEKSFFNGYIQIICGESLKSYQANMTKYIKTHSRKTSQIRQRNLSYLTQTNFNQRKSVSQLKSQQQSPAFLPSVATFPKQQQQKSTSSLQQQQSKAISSRQLKNKQPPFQQLSRLQFKKYKCVVYEKLSAPLKLTRNQIFYEFFKNNWEASYAQRKAKTLRR